MVGVQRVGEQEVLLGVTGGDLGVPGVAVVATVLFHLSMMPVSGSTSVRPVSRSASSIPYARLGRRCERW
jgi:hypothetical protein